MAVAAAADALAGAAAAATAAATVAAAAAAAVAGSSLCANALEKGPGYPGPFSFGALHLPVHTSVIIGICGLDLGPRIHHKRSIPDNGLVNRLACQQYQPAIGFGLQA